MEVCDDLILWLALGAANESAVVLQRSFWLRHHLLLFSVRIVIMLTFVGIAIIGKQDRPRMRFAPCTETLRFTSEKERTREGGDTLDLSRVDIEVCTAAVSAETSSSLITAAASTYYSERCICSLVLTYSSRAIWPATH